MIVTLGRERPYAVRRGKQNSLWSLERLSCCNTIHRTNEERDRVKTCLPLTSVVRRSDGFTQYQNTPGINKPSYHIRIPPRKTVRYTYSSTPSILRVCPKRIEKRNHKSYSFRFRGVRTESKSEIEIQAKSNGEHNLLGPFATVHTCRDLALGNTNPPQKQANATAFRFREIVGPPMEVVARPTLTPRDQT